MMRTSYQYHTSFSQSQLWLPLWVSVDSFLEVQQTLLSTLKLQWSMNDCKRYMHCLYLKGLDLKLQVCHVTPQPQAPAPWNIFSKVFSTHWKISNEVFISLALIPLESSIQSCPLHSTSRLPLDHWIKELFCFKLQCVYFLTVHLYTLILTQIWN